MLGDVIGPPWRTMSSESQRPSMEQDELKKLSIIIAALIFLVKRSFFCPLQFVCFKDQRYLPSRHHYEKIVTVSTLFWVVWSVVMILLCLYTDMKTLHFFAGEHSF